MAAQDLCARGAGRGSRPGGGYGGAPGGPAQGASSAAHGPCGGGWGRPLKCGEPRIRLGVGCAAQPYSHMDSSTLTPHRAESCGSFVTLTVGRGRGRATIARPPCGTWRCPQCGERKREAIVSHLASRPLLAGPDARVWYVVAQTPREVARVTDRLRHDPDDRDHLRVTRADDDTVTYVIAPPPDDLPTTPPRGRIVSPTAAIRLLGRALRPPPTDGRIIRVTWSDGWRPVPARGDGLLIGRVADGAEARQVFEAAAARATQETGYRPVLGVDLPADCPLSPSRWANILRAEWARGGGKPPP